MRRYLPALIILLASSASYAVHPREELEVYIPVPLKSSVSPTVSEAEEKIRTIPGSVALIDAATFENTRAVSVKDMLEFTPGVMAQQRVNEEARLSIRGSGLARNFHLRGLNLYQDHIPINLADGSADFQDVDPLALRYLEVFKGANALHLGSASLGGAINYVTPTGYDASEFGARAELGSFGFRREQLSSGQVVGDTDYFISLTDHHSDGYRARSDADNLRLFTNIGQKLNENLETRFYLSYGDLNQELPGSLTKAQLAANPHQANANNINLNYQRDFEFYRIANKTTWQGDGITVSGGVYTQQKDLYHPIFQLIDQESSTYGVFGSSMWDGQIGQHRNQFTLGTQLSQGDTDGKRYTNLAGDYGPLQASATEKAKNVSLYAENRYYARADLALIGGGQALYANREFHDRFFANGDQSAQRDYYGFSPRIGALWDYDARTQFFTNLSRSYEPPTLGDLTQAVPGFAGFADIDPQVADTLEIGTRGSSGRWDWDASLYHARIQDELMAFNIAPNTTRVLNADHTIHQGLELGLGVKLLDKLFLGCGCGCESMKLRLAYTYSDFHFDNDATYGDNQIPGAPEHFLRAELRYDHPNGWYVAPNIEAVPDGYPVDMANTLYSAGYATLGLRAGTPITDKVDLFLDARNLTDNSYAATVDVISVPGATNRAVFSPGDGRSAYVGLSYRF